MHLDLVAHVPECGNRRAQHRVGGGLDHMRSIAHFSEVLELRGGDAARQKEGVLGMLVHLPSSGREMNPCSNRVCVLRPENVHCDFKALLLRPAARLRSLIVQESPAVRVRKRDAANWVQRLRLSLFGLFGVRGSELVAVLREERCNESLRVCILIRSFELRAGICPSVVEREGGIGLLRIEHNIAHADEPVGRGGHHREGAQQVPRYGSDHAGHHCVAVQTAHVRKQEARAGGRPDVRGWVSRFRKNFQLWGGSSASGEVSSSVEVVNRGAEVGVRWSVLAVILFGPH
mmetsp:Transcript_23980/g.26639  ORF Transcript_23980/g.26639 Transcript_23980/m.26639 type:complete len:289 (-) Transcript_23980:111-977(-)